MIGQLWVGFTEPNGTRNGNLQKSLGIKGLDILQLSIFLDAIPICYLQKFLDIFMKKISERLSSIESQNFMTIPAAMAEADNLLLKYENSDKNIDLKNQLEEYDIYINFLNNYYNNKNINQDQFVLMKTFQ